MSIAIAVVALAAAPFGSGAAQTPAGAREAGAAPLEVSFEVVENRGTDFSAAITLTARGRAPLARRGWELYFNFVRMLLPESCPDTVTCTHVAGDLFKLEPGRSFEGLARGESLRIPFAARDWLIKESEAPAGFYLVETDAEGLPRPPLPLGRVRVTPFTRPDQTTRAPGDEVPVPTPGSRFERDRGLTRMPPDRLVPILPTPARLSRTGGQVTVGAGWGVRHEAGLENEATYLVRRLEAVLGTALRAAEAAGAAAEPRAIHLATDPAAPEEGYRLVVDPGGSVVVRGGGAAGVFYGVQSLLALAEPAGSAAVTLPAVEVEDAPRFGYRGMHLDVARNFHDARTVSRLLDLMAVYKLNRFHFHLTDDEGWRLPIDPLPELVGVGGRRGHTLDERDHLVPSLGSGPEPGVPPGSGAYTREEFLGILRHAASLHIEVVPEIDVPGHARAAIKAMESRHARLAAAGRPEEAEAFLLSDPDDRSEYLSVQMWDDNVVNVCRESTYRFLETVVGEVVAMYAEAGAPLRAIHIGGDEMPAGTWVGSPLCEALVARGEVSGTDELPGYFLDRLDRILDRHGLVTAGWEEIALRETHSAGAAVKVPDPAFVSRGLRPYVWNTVWGWGGEDLAYQLANAGYEIVMSSAPNLYFDLSHDKSPEEPGYYWADFVDERKPFELIPFDIFKSARRDRMGRPLDPAAFADRVRPTEEGRRNLLGIQGHLWSEQANSAELLEYMVFPKLLSMAERAWAAQPAWARVEDPAERESALGTAWNEFANRLGQRELPRLDRLFGGVAYRLPPPGARLEDGRLTANVAFPGLEIRYTTEARDPGPGDRLYTGPAAVDGPVRLRSFDRRGRGSRTSRIP